MDTKIEEIDITEKFKIWDLNFPEGLAFFPENIEEIANREDFVFAEPLTQLKKVFRLNHVEIETLGNKAIKLRVRKSADLYLPGLFVGLSLASQNQAAISIALSVLASYVTDFFKGTVGKKNVSLAIFVEKTDKKTITKIIYKGDAEGIKDLDRVIKQLK